MTSDVDSVGDELYGLPVDEFIATRNRHEKQARVGGDRELADRIRGLAKPNQAAWLANQLVRHHRDELQPLLDLGAELREATRTLAGDQLRQLSRQQHELVTQLVQQARALGRAQGHRVSEDTARGVADTLHAALADTDAADLLLEGRLNAPLHRSGFGDGDVQPAAVSRGPRGARPPATRPRKTQDDRQTRAQRALDAAVRSQDEARAAAEQAAHNADEAQAKVTALRTELDQARTAAADAEKHRRERDGTLRRAERAVAQAASSRHCQDHARY